MMSLVAIARRKPFSVIHLTAKPFASVPKYRIPDPKSSNFVVDYLISSFGFSLDKAATLSKRIAGLKTPQKPESVRHFLKHNGFTDPQIKAIISWCPEILSYSPENTLESNLRALREMGLSSPAVTDIILSDPGTLWLRNTVPRIEFWKDFLGGSEAALVTACKASRNLVTRNFAPKIPFLHSLGLSTREIQRIVLTFGFINNSPALIKELLNRAKELGFQPGLPMFVSGLRAVSKNSRAALQKKMELLKSYGWFEDDFFAALRKSPNIVYLAEQNLRTKMDFLVGEARCDLSYIASNPLLLTFSLEKRLRPRKLVLHLLESKNLSSQKHGFNYSIRMSDKKFVDTYIQPHKEELPGLHENYLAALRANSGGLDS